MATRVAQSQSIDGSSFLMGAVTGGAIAAGVALYFSPRLANVRERVTSSVADFRSAADSKVQTVENRVADVLDRAADVVDDVTVRAQAVRDDVATAVERGAHAVSQSARQVEHFAKTSKTDHQEKHA